MYFLVQLVASRNDKPPFLADGRYLVQAKDKAAMDGVAKALVAKHLTAQDYLHKQMPDDFAPSATITLANPDSIQLGQELYGTPDFAKIDWNA